MAKPTISEALPEYLAHLRARDLAASTIRGRRLSLLELGRVAGNVAVWNVSSRHLDAVFSKHSSWSPGTRNNRLSHYKSFFKWSRARGYMNRDADPTFGYRFAKVPTGNRLRIPVIEWPRLYDACELPRERMVLSLGLFLFLRSSEIRGIRLKDIDLVSRDAYVYRTKTRDNDVIGFGDELEEDLRAYLTWYSETIGYEPEHFLIPSSGVAAGPNGFVKGSRVYNPTKPYVEVHDIVKGILGRAGYPVERQGQHTLRRSGARAYFDSLVDNGYDGALRRVQTMLGHSHAYMSERYLGLELDRHRRNTDLRGGPMFPGLRSPRVVPIRKGL